jgi:quercetin dioxygenase-like cupin family protein
MNFSPPPLCHIASVILNARSRTWGVDQPAKAKHRLDQVVFTFIQTGSLMLESEPSADASFQVSEGTMTRTLLRLHRRYHDHCDTKTLR